MNQLYLILALFFSIVVVPLEAQVGFSIPIVNNAVNGSFINLPITVSGFDSVVSAQYVIRWDPQVLAFQDLDQFNLPDLNSSKFGTTNALDSGFIRFVWWYQSDEGTSLPNGTSIFNIKFKVIGPVNSGTPLYITELSPLTLFEVVKANGTVISSLEESFLNDGFVAVGYTLGIHEQVTSYGFSVQTYPNPFSEKTTVYVTLQEPDYLHIKLFDRMGCMIYNEDRFFPAGRNGMKIVSNILQIKDIYLLLIQSKKVSHVERLIFSE